jgi:4'-phosphopantetheinyl transferase
VTLLTSPTKKLCAATAVVWLIDADRVEASRIERCCKALGPAENARLGRFIRQERRTQYVLGRTLLRRAVGHFTGLPPTDIAVIEREADSPLLKLPASSVSPWFSISHSGPWIACAASRDTPLGLDIEAIKRKRERDVPGMAEAAYSVPERQYVMEADGDERLARFYRVWTTKEALFKLQSAQERKASLPDVASLCGLLSEGETWWSTVLAHPHLCITLCAALPLENVRVHSVSPDRLNDS